MRKLKTVAIILILSSIFSGCSVGKYNIVWDIKNAKGHTVFSVNDEKCYIKEARLYLANYKNLYGKEYGVDLWETCSDDQKNELESYIKDVTIDELTKIYCMVGIAQELKIELTSDELALVSDAAKEYYDSLSTDEKSFIGAGESDIKKAYENYALAQKIYDTLTKDIDTEVSDDDARVIHIEQIFVTSEESASVVAQKLAADEDFDSVMSLYNEGNSTDIYAAKGQLDETVEETAFNLNDGDVSEAIQTDDGYYFIKCISKLDQEKTDENKSNILEQREQAQFDDDYDSFVKNADFEYNSELWETVTVSDAGEITTGSFFEVYDSYFGS